MPELSSRRLDQVLSTFLEELTEAAEFWRRLEQRPLISHKRLDEIIKYIGVLEDRLGQFPEGTHFARPNGHDAVDPHCNCASMRRLDMTSWICATHGRIGEPDVA